jgi:hypothetical protein
MTCAIVGGFSVVAAASGEFNSGCRSRSKNGGTLGLVD